MIPVRLLIAGLLQNRLPLALVLNPPMCVIRKESDVILEKSGLGDTTPNVWYFWQRYRDLGITIVTNRNDPVDQDTWNLGTHVQYFKIQL